MGVVERIQALVGRPRGSAETAPAPSARPAGARNEIGWGGAKVFGGIVLDEYNPDLKGRLALQTADKMRRTSGQVRALEQVIRLPIESTQWIVEEPRQAGSAEREAAELLRENLFGGMEQPFSAVVREACLAIHFGFRVPEIVWEERAGLVAVADVASRNPELVERWVYDERGRLAGYVYAGHRPVGAVPSPKSQVQEGRGASAGGSAGLREVPETASTRFERVVVPLEKTLHFVHDAENGNPQGFGLWRSQYPHWYFYQALLKILGIGIERNLLGVPVGKQGDGAQDDDRQAVLTTLRRLRAAEDAAITLPPGWNLEWFESQRSLMDAMPSGALPPDSSSQRDDGAGRAGAVPVARAVHDGDAGAGAGAYRDLPDGGRGSRDVGRGDVEPSAGAAVVRAELSQ